MKSIGRRLLSSVCALALVANGFTGAMAQDKKQEKSAQGQNGERTFIYQREGQTVNIETSNSQEPKYRLGVPDSTGRLSHSLDGFGGILISEGGQQSGDSVFQYFSQEMSFDNRLVKGAPFSADIVSETIQTLPDGNRIVQGSEGRIYRDSQGRTRNERAFQMGGSSEQKQTINIFDPVGGVNYTLDPETRTARKLNWSPMPPPPPPPPMLTSGGSANADPPKKITVSGRVLQGSAIRKVQPPYPPIAKAAGAQGAVQIKVLISETGGVIEATVVSGHPLLRDAALQAARQWQFKPTEVDAKAVKVQGILTFNFTLQGEEPAAPVAAARRITKYSTNTEQLGKQMIEGVECEGTRAVTTIPAGAVGNERPIETVNESWYSPELKMMILTKRNDPRFGESTYRVTNISRAEPDAALFQVPSDYTVKEGGFGAGAALRANEFEYRPNMEMKIQAAPRKPNNQ